MDRVVNQMINVCLGMVEIRRPCDPSAKLRSGNAQKMLQAQSTSVMPAHAGIQVGEEVANTENLDSRFRGKDGRDRRLPVDIVEILRLVAAGCLIF